MPFFDAAWGLQAAENARSNDFVVATSNLSHFV
jgi:hypothetical protein